MIGAIAGGIIGSVYEANPIKTKEFPQGCSRQHFSEGASAADPGPVGYH